MDVCYEENAGVIELVSSQRTGGVALRCAVMCIQVCPGVFSLLDAECQAARSTAETLLQRLHVQHAKNTL